MLKKLENCLFLAFIFSLFVFLSPVFAAETGKMGIYPAFWDKTNLVTKSWFVYQLDKGGTREDQATVVNNINDELTVKIYPVDAKTTADGAFSPLLEEEPKNEVGAWITLPVSELTFKPHEKKEIKFKINIPDNAPVGEHAGAIIIEDSKLEQKNEAGVGLNIKQRVGVRVYVTIPGEKQVKLKWRNFSFTKIDGQYTFLYKLENQGNIILNPQGEIVIRQLWGDKTKTFEKQSLGSVFPGKTISPQIRWEDVPRFAILRAFAKITFEDQELSRSALVIILPWWLVIPVLAGILLLGFWKLKHLVHHHQKFKELMKIPEEETEDHHHKTVITIVISITIILACLGIFAFYKVITTWQLRQKIVNTTSQVKVTLTPTPLPTPVILTSEQKKNIPLIILNASGVRFTAANTKEFLESKGYRVKEIGNWEEEKETTLVSFNKEDFASASAAIVYDLKEMYTLPEAKLDPKQKEKIIIFIGKDKK